MKYPIKEELLDEWTPDLAYFLRVMISDGEVKPTGAVIDLQTNDGSALNYIRDWISPTRPINGPYIKKYKGKKTEYLRLSLSSKSFANKLMARFGIIPCKTGTESITFDLPEDMERHLIRGIFDGDGIVSLKTGPNGGKKYETGFVSPSRILLEQIKEIHGGNKGRSIREKKDRRKKQNGEPRSPMYSWEFGIDEGAKLRDWMYSGGEFGLPRKKEKLAAFYTKKSLNPVGVG